MDSCLKKWQFLVILHNIPTQELGTKSPQTRLLGLDVLPSFKSMSAAPPTPQTSPLTTIFFGNWQCWLMFKNNSHCWSFYSKCLHRNLVQSPRKPDFDGWLFFSFKSTSAAPPTPRAANSYSSEAQMCNFVKCSHTLIIQHRTST